jgi:16S rRNA processing protein RimM
MKISVAHILRPRGFKGELAVITYKENTESLKIGLAVTLQKGAASRDTEIQDIKRLKGRLALKFAGIDSDGAADVWRNGEVLAEQSDLASLGENEFYHFELEGSEVYEENGAYVGKVTGIDYFSANDILSVASQKGEILIPLVKSVVLAIDREKKRIVIRKIEGLY